MEEHPQPLPTSTVEDLLATLPDDDVQEITRLSVDSEAIAVLRSLTEQVSEPAYPEYVTTT